MDNENIIHAYKGFDKDLKCRGYQYEIGKDYEKHGRIKCCKNGFHACECPLNVFMYYAPGLNNRYCAVIQSGEIDKIGEITKVASSKIYVKNEIGLDGIIKAGVKFVLDNANRKGIAATKTREQSVAMNTGNYSAAMNAGYWSAATNTGHYSVATNTGYSSAATNTGHCSVATNTGDGSVAVNAGNCSVAENIGYGSVAMNTGDGSVAKVSGKESIAMVTGTHSKAAGALGDWIVLTERDEWANTKLFCQIKEVKAFKVDGEKIKADTFYKLVDGEAVEA